MTSKVDWDFSKFAVLEHVIEATGTFTGTAERGRAQVTLGSSNAKTRVSATHLGDYANGRTYVVRTPGGSGTVVTANELGWQVSPAAGATANDVIAVLNAFQENQGVRFNHIPARVRADGADGTGASAIAAGSGTLAGGVAPTELDKAWYRYSSDDDAGLFVFNHDQPLVLRQFGARLSSSTAWSLTLRPLTAAFGDQATPYTVTSGTGQNILLTETPVVIPVGWGLGFTASAQGRAFAGVRTL